jgi:hypothetical protein
MRRTVRDFFCSSLIVTIAAAPAFAQSAPTPAEQQRVRQERQRLLSLSPAQQETIDQANQQKLELYLDSLADQAFAVSGEHTARRTAKNDLKEARNLRVAAEQARLANLIGADRDRLNRIQGRRQAADLARANSTIEETESFDNEMDRLLALIEQNRN